MAAAPVVGKLKARRKPIPGSGSTSYPPPHDPEPQSPLKKAGTFPQGESGSRNPREGTGRPGSPENPVKVPKLKTTPLDQAVKGAQPDNSDTSGKNRDIPGRKKGRKLPRTGLASYASQIK